MSFIIRSAKLTRSSIIQGTLTSTIRSQRITVSTNSISTRGFGQTVAKMGVHNLSSKDDFQAAITNNNIVVLDAFATWCGPCKVIAPTVVKYSDEFPDVHFVKVDVDEVPDVAQELAIRAMPTFLVFKNGERVGEVVGADKNKLHAAIQDAIKAE